jgi:hypothetical protein
MTSSIWPRRTGREIPHAFQQSRLLKPFLERVARMAFPRPASADDGAGQAAPAARGGSWGGVPAGERSLAPASRASRTVVASFSGE